MANDDAPALAHLLGELPSMVYQCLNDEAWTMVKLSGRVRDLTGYEADDILGNRVTTYAELIHPDDRERVWSEVQSAVEREEPFRLAYRIVRRGGGERWVWEQGEALPDSAGEGGRLVGFIQDVTGLRAELSRSGAMEAMVASKTAHLDLLNVVTAAANRAGGLCEVLEEVLPEICGRIGWPVAHVYMPDPDGRLLLPTDIWHLGDPDRFEAFREVTNGRSFELGEGLPGRVFASGKPEWIEDLAACPHFDRVTTDSNVRVRSGLAVPVTVGAHAVAVLEMFSEEARRPEPDLLGVMEQVGIQIGRVREREETEARHRESEARFAQLADHVDTVFWVRDARRRIVYVNRALEDVWGLPREAFLEGDDAMLDTVVPEDRALVAEMVEKIFSGGPEATFDYRMIRSDGEVRWIRSRTFAVFDDEGNVTNMVGLSDDVTEERAARQALAETTRRLSQTFSSLAEAVFIVQPNGRGIVDCNEAVERMFGYTREELIGLPTRDLHVDEAAFRRFAAVTEPDLREGRTVHTQYQMRRRDGSVFATEHTISLLDPEAGLEGEVVSVVRDISERVVMEERLRRAQRMEAVGGLAGGIAHDFNNLLTVVGANIELLLDEIPGDLPGRSHGEAVRSAVGRARDLTRQLLAFSREQVLSPRVVSLNDVVETIERLVRRVLRADIVIETRLERELRAADVDAGQIEQVLMNLLVNARDAMPDGGKITIETDNEDLRTSRSVGDVLLGPGAYVVLSVSDTGTGMDEDTRAKIFEPFFTTKPKEVGTGLGLAMVYGTVVQSGGAIEVTSSLGEGTTFRIRLPASDFALKSPATDLPAQDREEDMESKAVLLVEDDPDVRRALVKMLSKLGHHVTPAESAEHAARILSDGEEFALVVTDMMLPGKTGAQLLQEIREREPSVAGLVISGYTESETREQLFNDPRIHYLPKPFDHDELRGAIGEAMRRVRAMDHRAD